MSGFVYLVGAGPGDPGLLTLRAVEVLGRADVVLHDKLIPFEALDHVRAGCELVDVGKIGGGPQVPQAETERLLLEHAQAGKVVVRLKGGDPYVFGRGGEEGRMLREHGIGFEVVPGVTAGIAAPAYAGIPVTFRGASSAVAFVTGHEDPKKPETAIDWEALARFPGTLIFYMGVRQLPRIAEQLIAHGRPADQPAGIVERGTLPGQRSLTATLRTLPEQAAAQAIKAPAITVIGDVAALRDELGWFEHRPLAGRTVVVTRARARAQASKLAGRLRELGAAVVEAPAIRIEPLPVELPDLGAFQLLCVTSPNGADRLLDEVGDARRLAGLTIAAIGPGTARALQARGIVPDVLPERPIAESLVDALADVPFERALIARAEEGRDVLPDALAQRGEVTMLPLYRTVAEQLDPETTAAALAADYVTFTSGSSVHAFLGALDGPPDGPRRVSIGPATSDALREHGLEPDVEADLHTPDGLVDALLADACAPRSS
jgi:uroporphyrinogen III methyltransferase/synthase